MQEKPWDSGIIGWFATNPVAANLLMIILLVTGLMTALFFIKKEIQPRIETNAITVTVPYLGAAPEEVEEGVVVKIEEAIQGIEGIKEITSTAAEGVGRVTVEVQSGFSVDKVMDDMKIRVDAIATFPDETEKSTISRAVFQQQVIFVSIYGDLEERFMKEYVQLIRDEIVALPEVSVANVLGSRAYEVAIEVSELTLREYGLTLDEVANAIRRSSLDLPGGAIKAEGGDILLRTKGQVYFGEDFEKLVLRTQADGTRLLLGDIAEVRDGFVERERFALLDGQQSFTVQVFSVGTQSELDIAQAVKKYVEERKQDLPPGMQMAAWVDISTYLSERLAMMNKNVFFGSILVFCVLSFFLRIRLAFWVMVGIPVAFLGTIALMPIFDVTINMLSLFGFILVLGIVVDDAIVIGESCYSEIRAKGHSLENVVRGAKKVAMPATFGVLTTVAAFMPMLFIGGVAAKIWESIALVVVLCLLFSLVESKLILPAHLAHMKLKKAPKNSRNPLLKAQRFVSNGMESFVARYYQPALDSALRYRYATFMLFLAAMVMAIGLLWGGQVRSVFFPNLTADFIQAELRMAEGTPVSETRAALERIQSTLARLDREVSQEHGQEAGAVVQHIFAWMPDDLNGRVIVELVKDQYSVISAPDIIERWRSEVGDIAGANRMAITGATGTGGGAPIAFQLMGRDFDMLSAAAEEVKQKLKGYEGLHDIRSTYDVGKQEIRLQIKPQAENLGLSLNDLARQVRQGFYGAEAQRIQRGRDEVRVMVRYPRDERETIGDLENMRIRTPQGDGVPFNTVAEVDQGKGYSTITRVDRRRAVTVSADADLDIVEPGPVVQEMFMAMPGILAKYPGVTSEITGAAREQQELVGNLLLGAALVLFAIYALMAIPLKSYSQPAIIMAVIPFGIIGAIFGHWLVGLPMSFFSYFGIIALSGVVVNDSLIMVDFVNKARAEGNSLRIAARLAGGKRFRAIILTSLTTFFGLLPMLLEKSLQAQIMIPMAVSLAFGILFATVITLFFIPSLYLILDDIKAFFRGEDMALRAQMQEIEDRIDQWGSTDNRHPRLAQEKG
ncbi:MAG: acriflavin resistance protein [Lysobacteraceae bacterium]|nr:MAG: acriflavin resistance protein [Xanthomonadaceae bacterium]